MTQEPPLTVQLRYAREHPRTVRYTTDDPAAPVSKVYVLKDVITARGNPATLTLTIELGPPAGAE